LFEEVAHKKLSIRAPKGMQSYIYSENFGNNPINGLIGKIVGL
jgi:hypothetical protein